MGRVCDRVARLTLTQGLKLLVALISLFNFEIFVRIYKFQNLFSEIIGWGNCKKQFLSKCYWNFKVGNDLIVFAFQAAFFCVLVSTDLLFSLELICRDRKLSEMLTRHVGYTR